MSLFDILELVSGVSSLEPSSTKQAKFQLKLGALLILVGVAIGWGGAILTGMSILSLVGLGVVFVGIIAFLLGGVQLLARFVIQKFFVTRQETKRLRRK